MTDYGYTGELTDVTGMVDLRAREYDPGTGRFISQDTWSGNYLNPLSLNKWNYVEANPVNDVDPSGKWALASGFDLENGGFYGQGVLKFSEPFPCTSSCNPSQINTADIFVESIHGNDMEYSQYLIEGINKKDFPNIDLTKAQVKLIGIRTILDQVCSLDTNIINIPKYIHTNYWNFAKQYSGITYNFDRKSDAVTGITTAMTDPDVIPDNMSITGNAFSLGPQTYGEATESAGASVLSLVQIAEEAEFTIMDQSYRKYTINIEQNAINPQILRAQIETQNKSGKYHLLEFVGNQWIEVNETAGLILH